MKKTIISVLVLMTFVITGCGLLDNTEVKETDLEKNETVSENEAVVEETPVVETVTYSDSQLGIEISFPKTWGTITSQPISESEYSLYSDISPERTVILKIVDTTAGESLSTNEGQTSFFLGQKDGKYYYFLMDYLVGIIPEFTEENQKNLEEELKSVIPSFKTL